MAATRAILYLRQSTHREESISLELQESAGRDYCARQGYAVVGVESDPGISGRTWRRPAVQRVMAAVDAREVDVVVLWKWSRLSRSRVDWAVAADRVEQAGGRIESATEPLDTATSVGRLARGMMTEIAAFESERIGDVWRETHERRVRRGLPANGKPRFGYAYDRVDGFSPDPSTGPVLAQAYRRYIDGQSIYAIVNWLNDSTGTSPASGYGATPHGQWSDRTLRRVLDSGFGAGLITRHGAHLPGAHLGVISEHEWQRYVEARESRRVRRSGERSTYAYSGLVRCECGSKMHAQRESTGQARYRCAAAKTRRAHSGGYVWESVVDRVVHAFLDSLADDAPAVPAPPLVPRRDVTGAIVEAQQRVDALTMRYVEGGIPRSSYDRLVTSLESDIAALQAEHRAAVVRPAARPHVPSDAVAAWHGGDAATQRESLRQLIEAIEVSPGRPHATVRVIALWGDSYPS
jgi:site-specific DNA recombinase